MALLTVPTAPGPHIELYMAEALCRSVFPLAHKAPLEEVSDRELQALKRRSHHKVGYFPTERPVSVGVTRMGSWYIKCDFLFES